MGSGISGEGSLSKEQAFAFQVVMREYELLRENEKIKENGSKLQQHLDALYKTALAEYHLPWSNITQPACILVKLEEGKGGEGGREEEEKRKELENEFLKQFMDALIERDKTLPSNSQNAVDYSKGFSGTKADTDAEKDFAKMLRQDDNTSECDQLIFPILNKLKVKYQEEENALRLAGKWCKYLSKTGCYMYCHSLTKSLVSVRPDDYEEQASEVATGIEEVKDPANGLPSCNISDLLSKIEELKEQNNKTLLILDGTSNQACLTFFSIKAMLSDVSNLVVPYATSGIKRQDVIEKCRSKLVGALKTGSTYVLYLGSVTIEHADFKTKLCKKDSFPIEIFQQSGAKLYQPKRDPLYKALYREADLESGQAIARDGFRFICVSTLSPYDYQAQLEESIPLGYMTPLYVYN